MVSVLLWKGRCNMRWIYQIIQWRMMVRGRLLYSWLVPTFIRDTPINPIRISVDIQQRSMMVFDFSVTFGKFLFCTLQGFSISLRPIRLHHRICRQVADDRQILWLMAGECQHWRSRLGCCQPKVVRHKYEGLGGPRIWLAFIAHHGPPKQRTLVSRITHL